MNKAIPLIAAGAGGALAGYLLHDEVKKNIDYGSYLLPHKYYTYKAMREMGLPFKQSVLHDVSKLLPAEWTPHADWFNGPTGLRGTKDRETFLRYKDSRKVHTARNAHHWRMQGLTPDQVSMPVKMETVADWYGVNRARGVTKEKFKDWYFNNRGRLPIDNFTKTQIEATFSKEASAYYIAAALQEDAKQKLPRLNNNIHDNSHITLKFLGNVSPEQLSTFKHTLKNIAGSHRKFNATLSGYDNFINKNKPVFYASVAAHGALKGLQKQINEEIGIPDSKEFVPHVTLDRSTGPGFSTDIAKVPVKQIRLLEIMPNKPKVVAKFSLKDPNILQSLWDKIVNE